MNKNNEIMCLWFPYLLVEISFSNHTKFNKDAFAIILKKRNKQILYSINPVGELMGLKLGMSLSEAHILCKNLVTEKYNHKKKDSFMITQARWCGQFTPRISIEKENTLLLNLKGCTHLFGKTENIIKIICNHFKKINISLSYSFEENITIAKARAKFNSNETEKNIIISTKYPDNFINIQIDSNSIIERNHNLLKKIPIEALVLNNSEKEELKYLGIETIYQLQSVSRKDLLVRFGPKVIESLKKFIGIDPELTSYLQPEDVFSRSINLPEPVSLMSDLIKLFEKLTRAICTYMKNMDKGTRTLNFQLRQTDHTKQLLQIRTSKITSNPEDFIILFKTKINQIEASFGIEFIRVYAHKVENIFQIQNNLQIDNIEKDTVIHQTLKKEEYKNLISKLSNKMGFDSLIHLYPSQSHIPENNVQKVSAVYCSPKSSWPLPLNERPLLMFTPEQIKIIKYREFLELFIWRKKQYNVSVRFGPERIAAEWWLDNPQWHTGLRDYWKIETYCGTRLWLFEAKGAELNGGWFIHGNFI